MKKTLIALAVAASAAVSGSAMAWTANGTGGSVDLGGTLTPVVKVTPWEVQVGAKVGDLDATIIENATETEIVTKKPIPILGIRTISKNVFKGTTGISPRISFNKALDLNSFSNSIGTITLDVMDANNSKIGTLNAPMFAAAEISKVSLDGSFQKLFPAFASGLDRSFGGGLPRAENQMMKGDVGPRAVALYQDATLNFNTQGIQVKSGPANADNFISDQYTHSAYYVSGIEQGGKIHISLDNPASANTSVVWNASLPVTVSYQ
ncbi:hypothetical protein [Escherichia sp. E3659]|uniref:F4 family fimbrial subunit n=1 Tax=Escherichia sp. E3659 TaxID=2044462 RepID=UPI001485053A|nr:hypothetical protein [Escherichia sp. E3659]